MLKLDEIYKVGGHQVLFLVDEYGADHTFNDGVQLTPQTPKAAASFVSDAEVERARERIDGTAPAEPEAPASASDQPPPPKSKLAFLKPKKSAKIPSNVKLYGLWQTAIHNHAVNFASPLTIVPFSDDDESSGLFLICEAGVVVHSGLYRGRYIPNAPVALSQATRLEITPEILRRWRVPPVQARTTVQIARDISSRKSSRVLRIVFMSMGSLVVSCVVYYLISVDAEKRTNQMTQATSAASLAETNIKTTKLNKLTPDRYPDGLTVLSSFSVLQLIYATSGLTIDWDDIEKPEFVAFTATGSAPLYPLSFQHQRLIQPDGSYVYSWQKEGGAP